MRILCFTALLMMSVSCMQPPVAETKESGWSLKKINGVTTVFHNGKPMIFNMVYSEDQKMPKYTTCLSQIFSREAGITTYQLPTDVDWEEEDIKKGTHEKDLIKRISLLLEDSPDAYVMIRILLWPPKKTWMEKYPEDMVWDESGKISENKRDPHPPTSLMSEFYINKAAEAVERIAKAVKNSEYSDHVIGYMPCIGSSGESNAYRNIDLIADYSPAARKAFSNYLLEKYGNVEKINANLGTSFKDASELRVPTEKEFNATASKCFFAPNENRFAHEYYIFTEDTIVDDILALCRATKRVSPDKLTGTFFGQVIQAGQWGVREHLTYGRYFWKRLASSPDFDFVSTPSFYKYSGVEHPLMMQSILDSINLYGKVFIIEYDRPTHLLTYLPVLSTSWYIGTDGLDPCKMSEDVLKERIAVFNKNRDIDYGKNFKDIFVEKEKEGTTAREFTIINDRCPADMRETINNIRRFTAFCVTRPTAGLWWWDQEGTRRKTIGGMAFNHPELMNEIKKSGEIFDKAVTMNRSSRAEVAVFYDNISMFYRVPSKGRDYIADAFVNTAMALGETGIPHDEYFFEEIEDIPNIGQYKMFIFLNSNYISSERRKWIDKNLKKDGKTLIWFFASGLIDENKAVAKNIEKLTGIGIKEENEPEIMACSLNRIAKTPLSGIPERYQAFGNLELSKRYSPWYSIEDKNAVIMGKSIINNKAVFGMKEFPAWRSVMVPTGPIPVPVFRALAKVAGIHFYTKDENVVVTAAKDLMSVHTYRNHHGNIVINLPPDVSGCTDMYSDERYPVKNGQIHLNVEGFTVKLLHLEHR